MLAIIGGSGLSRPDFLTNAQEQRLPTPYGDHPVPVFAGQLAGEPVLFIARHGAGHTIPPHRINYRANLWALKQAGATAVVAQATVGGIVGVQPGDLALPDQLIDYTWGRAQTFFDGGKLPVRHVDFTHPYDPALRQGLLKAATQAGIEIKDGGVYAATQGPRLETAAEVRRLKNDGATVVGMTGMPEAALARELDLPYASLVVVVNDAAGTGDSHQRVTLSEAHELQAEGVRKVQTVLAQLASRT
ncbi:MAG: S-methyl-5'-thioinosine phosphorylase [Zoogloeaceae bacterium]|jgi:5'-methylthioadenosine phosphorylase|nr:S-methyl-5'-thioinosine phosphorylase [Zoogloeaceae bacterium]